MRRKKSIRTKILRATLTLLFIFSIVMGMVSAYVVSKLSEEDSQRLMRQICDKEVLRFDNRLNLVEHSVNMIYEYARELCEIKGEDFDIYSDEYAGHVEEIAVAIADRTDGAMAVYFRYNPDMVGNGTSGFLWSKKPTDDSFKKRSATNILAYSTKDIKHVGWFFIPKETGKPLWMTPYYNQNLDTFMISYVIPFYLDNGEFVGVIGMDIDFNSIMEIAGEVNLYRSGKVALVDMSEHLYYTSNQGKALKNKLSNALYNHITTINRSDELLRITEWDGSESVICCDSLSNGMKLFVSVPLDEIHANRNILIRWWTVIFILTLVVTLIIISKNTARITKPLKRLTEITNQYAQGDWTENYISDTSDEIQELSECIAAMAHTNQSYISRINYMARTDGLTGLGNKTCYYEYIEQTMDSRKEGFLPYAVVVMDINLLKYVNDNYGHEAGDILIREAGDYISGTFGHSAVFRIGGDEYVAILRGQDYERRQWLCEKFEEHMNYEVVGIQGVRLSISYGMASYDEDGVEYDVLFRLADDRMYDRKRRMKKSQQEVETGGEGKR